jgi:hypothetical protein
MAIIPSSKYPWGDPGEEATMAEIYTRLGDADRAIPILERLLQLPIGSLGLRRHCYDRIRDRIESATIRVFKN